MNLLVARPIGLHVLSIVLVRKLSLARRPTMGEHRIWRDVITDEFVELSRGGIDEPHVALFGPWSRARL